MAVVYALARNYHCTIMVGSDGIAIRRRGIIVYVGTVDAVKAMTVRGLIGMFEEITQDWRYEPWNE